MRKFFEAIRAGDRQGVQALVEANPSLAIFVAAIQGDTVAIETLLAANRPLVSAVSSHGWTPLRLAAHFGKLEAVRLLPQPKRSVCRAFFSSLDRLPYLF